MHYQFQTIIDAHEVGIELNTNGCNWDPDSWVWQVILYFAYTELEFVLDSQLQVLSPGYYYLFWKVFYASTICSLTSFTWSWDSIGAITQHYALIYI